MAARTLFASIGIASVLVAASVASGAADDPSARCAGTPVLRLIDADPVTFKGTGFCAGERVRVRARASQDRHARRHRADGGGSFRVRFRGIQYDPCVGSLRASAWSAGELRARFKRAPKQCPVPLPPQDPPAEPGPYSPGPGGGGCNAAVGGKPGLRRQCPPA